MLAKIKAYLKNLVQQVTGLSSGQVFTEFRERIEDYDIAGWASIISTPESYSSVFDNEQNMLDVMRCRKYDVTLPVKITICGDNESQVCGWKYSLLATLPFKFVTNEETGGTGLQFVNIVPNDTVYSDTISRYEGMYIAETTIEFKFSIFTPVMEDSAIVNID